MEKGIQEFGINEGVNEEQAMYFIKYLKEGMAAGTMMLDTFLDLDYAQELELESLIEDLVEQIVYLTNLTNKTFLQQLPEEIQDEILESKLYFVQVKYRHEYLSSGRLVKSPSMVLSKLDPTESDINWTSTKELSLIGLYKYLSSVQMLTEEAKVNKDIKNRLTDEDMIKINKFANHPDLDDILNNTNRDLNTSEVLKADYHLDSKIDDGYENDGDGGEEAQSFVNFGDLI